MKMKLLLFVFIWLIVATGEIWAGEVHSKIKPLWIRSLPRPGNSSYYFKVVYTDAAATLDEARVLARKELAMSIQRSEHIRIDENLEYHSVGPENTGKEVMETNYSFKVLSEGESQYLRYERVDEYWESKYEQGRNVVCLHTLYAVGREVGKISIDHYTISTQYGARALVRSLIPGWGQIYKGSTLKGGCILGGEIVFVGGIIVAETQRASYIKKMKDNRRQIGYYNMKADNWENVRNICIGAATVLYVYNLVDAIVTPGVPRLVREKQRSFVFMPAVAPDYNGISLVYKF